MREADAHGGEPGRRQPLRQLARAEDADVPARRLEVVVAHAQVQVLAGGGRDGDGHPPARLRHARQLARRGAVVVHVLHHLGADHLVEAGSGRAGEGVALTKIAGIRSPSPRIASRSRFARRPGRSRSSRPVDAAVQRPEAIRPSPQPRRAVLAAVAAQALEVDGEQHARLLEHLHQLGGRALPLEDVLDAGPGGGAHALGAARSASTSWIAAASARGSRGGPAAGAAVAADHLGSAPARSRSPAGRRPSPRWREPKPSKKDGRTATRAVEYCSTSSESSACAAQQHRSSSFRRRIARSHQPSSGCARPRS